MATSPPDPVGGTVSSDGRLTEADAPLARLQEEAGSELGQPLAVPQLALIVRLARKLGVTISRPALAASAERDLDLWVRAEPQNGNVRLTIESWIERPPQQSRWPARAPTSAYVSATEDRFELDLDLRLTSLAPGLAAILGTTPERATGLPLTRLVQLEEDDRGEMPLLGALGQRRDFAGQRAVARRGGAELTLSGQVRLASDGSFAGFIGRAARDADVEAIPVSAELDELLRMPIDRIVSEAQQISDRTEGPLRSDYAAYASDIMAASRHLLDVLHSMSGEAGEKEEGEDRIDLAALAAEAADLVQAQAVTAGVTLELEGETGLPARGEARAVTQILVNLAGNAVRHSPRGGTVRITSIRGTAAQVTVTDEGPGVSGEDRERIFEPFEQAAPNGEGAGLGLAISRRLARSMGGDILLDTTPGQGARFTLSLPLA